MKIFEKTPVFVVLYLLAMLPTYVLPYLGSNSSAVQSIGIASEHPGGGNVGSLFLAHLVCLMFLMFITWAKGKSNARGWIVIFPVMAAVFDLLPGLSLIPLAPTLMHVLAIIFGARGQPKVVVVEAVGD